MFISDELDVSCRERYELRTQKKLYEWGDGDNFMVYNAEKDDYIELNIVEHEKIIKNLHTELKTPWTTVLSLYFVIPRISRVFGCWQFTTKAEKTSIPEITSTFDTVKELAGTIVGIPFDLVVQKVTSQKPESKASYPVVKIVPNISHAHLEKVRHFIDAGKVFRGMLLTEETIRRIEYEIPEQK
jgi:hypothetical protein